MKGYPKFKAEIVDQSQIMEIETTTLTSGDITVIMQTYTSDKGEEQWEILRGFDGLTDVKGPISFKKHGQAQLTVAEILRNGGIVLGKRIVSDDADLANITLRARVVQIDDTSYLYFYYTSMVGAKTFKEAAAAGKGDFDVDEVLDNFDGTLDVPLFTVSPKGRGLSTLSIRLVPEYNTTRNRNNYIQFSFEVYDGVNLMQSIPVSMNPNIIINNESQALNPKIRSRSTQVQINLNDEALDALIAVLSKTAVMDGEALPAGTLINMDFINGYDLKGKNRIGGIVTCVDRAEDGSDEWNQYMPSDIADTVVDISGIMGVALPNGTNGTMGERPLKNTAEYEKMLLGAWGKDTNSLNYSPMIYDLDMFKIDAVFDCDWPMSVKQQILNVADFRGDLMYFADLNQLYDDVDSIIDYAQNLPYSRNISIYHNYFNVYDPYTKREISVTMPYLLAIKMVSHLNNGVAHPFAGIANNLTFEEDIIEGTLNFKPYITPGNDEKQMLVDNNINYINFYDSVPTMDTMYTNNEEHSQLSYLSNVMNVQQVIKRLRTECPRRRYTWVDGEDLEKYLEDTQAIIDEYKSQYNSITVQYMYDEKYENNKIFYATLVVKFREFFDEEFFRIFAIN